jgi:hypothetical protein
MRFWRGKRFVIASVASCALLVLGAAGASAAKSHASSDPEVTLTVTITGPGTGWVTGVGISCGTVCSAQFPAETYQTLTVQAGAGSTIAGLSNCTGSGVGQPPPTGRAECDFFLDAGDQSVEVTFGLPRPTCIVPGLRGTTLAHAKSLLLNHPSSSCRLGVTYAFSRTVKKGRIISQNPTAHWRRRDGKVNIIISKGRR